MCYKKSSQWLFGIANLLLVIDKSRWTNITGENLGNVTVKTMFRSRLWPTTKAIHEMMWMPPIFIYTVKSRKSKCEKKHGDECFGCERNTHLLRYTTHPTIKIAKSNIPNSTEKNWQKSKSQIDCSVHHAQRLGAPQSRETIELTTLFKTNTCVCKVRY